MSDEIISSVINYQSIHPSLATTNLKSNSPYFIYNKFRVGGHRFGWDFVSSELEKLFTDPDGIYFNTWTDVDYMCYQSRIPDNVLWVGIFHLTPVKMSNYYQDCNIDVLFTKKEFVDILHRCRGIFTLSNYMKEYIKEKLQILGHSHIIVDSLYHPIPMYLSLFNPDRINTINTIVSLGCQMRKCTTIYKIKTKYNRIWLSGRSIETSYTILDTECNENNIHISEEERSVVQIKRLPNDEYDRLLENSFIIIDLYDASANNALIECISRNIPCFVSRIPATEEYIGSKYPLLFNDTSELECMLQNKTLIRSAYEYLVKNSQLKERIRIESFINDIEHSPITVLNKSIPLIKKIIGEDHNTIIKAVCKQVILSSNPIIFKWNNYLENETLSATFPEIYQKIQLGRSLANVIESFFSTLHFEYGSDSHYIDITKYVILHCIEPITIKCNVHYENKWCIYIPSSDMIRDNLFTDPIPGIHKFIKIYHRDSVEIYSEDQEIIIIIPNLNEPHISCVNEYAQFQYGTNNSMIDVTTPVLTQCMENISITINDYHTIKTCIFIDKSNMWCDDFFGDPCPTITKSIRILQNQYEFIASDMNIILLLSNSMNKYISLNLKTDFMDNPYKMLIETDDQPNLYQNSISSNKEMKYSMDHFINEEDIDCISNNTIDPSNIDMLQQFTLIIDSSNTNETRSFFLNSILSYYKYKNTFLIVRKDGDNMNFYLNNDYKLSVSYNEELAIQFLTHNQHKIQKIIYNHTLYHTSTFLDYISSINAEKILITHDYYTVINKSHPYLHELQMVDQMKIDTNHYNSIIFPNEANYNHIHPYVSTHENIISPFPDYQKSLDRIQINHSYIVVGLIGEIYSANGQSIVEQLINKYKNNSNIQIVIFSRSQSTLNYSNQHIYQNVNELNSLLQIYQPNILLETSIWPDIYQYSLTLSTLTQLPILYLKKKETFVVEKRLSQYNKAFPFSNMSQLIKLIYQHKQQYLYTIEPKIYFNSVWNHYFLTKTSSSIQTGKYKYDIKPFCIYFPQYHVIKENNVSFYDGYTDVTNLKLLKESHQNINIESPNMKELHVESTDMISYHLENSTIIQKQIDLLFDYDIGGFGMYYYWFSTNTITNKNMIMKKVIDQFFSDSINMRGRKIFFMWANEDWTKNPHFGTSEHHIENHYNDINYHKNITQLLIYFHHEQYLKIDNKPVFFLHHPHFMESSQIDQLYSLLSSRCIQEGFSGVHFIVNSAKRQYTPYSNYHINFNYKDTIHHFRDSHGRACLDYKKYFDNYSDPSAIQTLVFDFDNRARMVKPSRLHHATICKKNTEFEKIKAIHKLVQTYDRSNKSEIESILLINSWNEWGEKMSIEPSSEYGYYYLNLLQSYLK